MDFTLNTSEIILRLIVATAFAAIIGFDRETSNRPAGLRTHILVCLGACTLALIQQAICHQVLFFAKNHHALSSVLGTDPARLIAQVVGGIGFIGAGTIVITHHVVTGLTTAASLWATASIGLAIGMGYYWIAFWGGIIILLVVVILHRVVDLNAAKRVEIKYTNRETLDKVLQPYFKEKEIQIQHLNFKTDTSYKLHDQAIYTGVYTLKFPKKMTYLQMVEDLSTNAHIFEIHLVAL